MALMGCSGVMVELSRANATLCYTESPPAGGHLSGRGWARMPPMRRPRRLVVLIVAAMLQLAAPLAAYARVATVADFADLCSATSVATRGAPGHGAPAPMHQHCAQSLCCIGGAAGAIAPPPTTAESPFIPFAGVALLATSNGVAKATMVAAASPRGPPSFA